MAVSPNSIITPQQPRANSVTLSTTANTNYTAPTNTTLIANAGVNGARLTKLRVIPTGTVTATQIQLFRSSDSGVTKRFVNSILVPAYSMSGTTIASQTDFGFSDISPMILTANEQIYLAPGVSGAAINAECEWADY
jgi:hypothetical protein